MSGVPLVKRPVPTQTLHTQVISARKLRFFNLSINLWTTQSKGGDGRPRNLAFALNYGQTIDQRVDLLFDGAFSNWASLGASYDAQCALCLPFELRALIGGRKTA
jgi:hypothetical protein